jgi:hypothetical protein
VLSQQHQTMVSLFCDRTKQEYRAAKEFLVRIADDVSDAGDWVDCSGADRGGRGFWRVLLRKNYLVEPSPRKRKHKAPA